MHDDKVAVIIPVHNGIAHLSEAVRSALDQTYPADEIIIIDDGSTDDSVNLARWYAASDSRIRVLQQPQRGPGAARNLGIASASGELIAPLDADDLWRPTKLERQVEAIRKGGSRVGLVYTWFALIDDRGRVLSTGHRPISHGDVLRDCCRRNIIGNGSGALMRRSAILESGGYDEELSGCEDYKLYTAIAEHHHFAIVSEHLTGYRQSDHSLTTDLSMMCESLDLVLSDLERRHPEMGQEIHEHRLESCHWLLRRGVAARTWDLEGLRRVITAVWNLDRGFALRSVATLPKDLVAARFRRNRHRARYFLNGPPAR